MLSVPGEVSVSLNKVLVERQEVTSSFAPCHPLGTARTPVSAGVRGGTFPAVSGYPCMIYTCCVRQTFTYPGTAAHAASPQLQRGLPSASPCPWGAGLEGSTGAIGEAAGHPLVSLRRGKQSPITSSCVGHLLGRHLGTDPTQWLVEGSRWHKGMHIAGRLPPNIHFPNSPPSHSTDLQAFLLLPDPTLPGTAGSQLRQTSDGRQLMEQGTAKTQKRQSQPQGERHHKTGRLCRARTPASPEPSYEVLPLPSIFNFKLLNGFIKTTPNTSHQDRACAVFPPFPPSHPPLPSPLLTSPDRNAREQPPASTPEGSGACS